jgi:hypothetical protein
VANFISPPQNLLLSRKRPQVCFHRELSGKRWLVKLNSLLSYAGPRRIISGEFLPVYSCREIPLRITKKLERRVQFSAIFSFLFGGIFLYFI